MSGRLDAEGEPIIHRSSQILLASDVSFGGLNGRMPQQELDLFQFAACGVAQPRAGPFEEPPPRTFPFSRLRSGLFFHWDQFVA